MRSHADADAALADAMAARGTPAWPAARNRLLLAHRGLVGIFVRYYARFVRHLDADDLFAEGIFGLARAADGFDPARGVKFNSYAGHWVRAYIRRAIDNQERTIRMPVRSEEVLRARDQTPDQARRARSLVGISADRPASLDAPLAAGFDHGGAVGKLTLKDRLIDPGPRPDDRVLADEAKQVAEDLLACLSDRDREIVRRRLEGETLEEIGASTGRTRECIRLREAAALRHMRDEALRRGLDDWGDRGAECSGLGRPWRRARRQG